MMCKKKLLIINTAQYGYLTDSYKWCNYLKDVYDITLLCFDFRFPKLNNTDVKVKYISSSGNRAVRGVRFLFYSFVNAVFFKGVTMVVYFEYCGLLKKILPWKKMILDIRTLSVTENEELNKKADLNLFRTCNRFNVVSVISEGVKSKIQSLNKPSYILPLGAEVISNVHKEYDSLKLLYVGTLANRDIGKTIYGLKSFLEKIPDGIDSYDIVGCGDVNEYNALKSLTTSLGLNKVVKFHGLVPRDKLKPFFDKGNIGVSFVPITSYYEYQPPTKTYEYALSGLFVIATATYEHGKILTKDNGLMINDSAQNFSNALESIYNNRNSISERAIRDSLSNYTWEQIITNYLKPMLNSL